jgi:hypothetical protein
LTVSAHGLKITFMTRKTAPLAAALAFATLVLSCSEAPVVPVQPTNRRVLAELVSETG